MQVFTQTVTFGASPVQVTTNSLNAMACRLQAEPLVGNANGSTVKNASNGGVIRQFPAAATTPVVSEFRVEMEENVINMSNYAFDGTAGQSMLVSWWVM